MDKKEELIEQIKAKFQNTNTLGNNIHVDPDSVVTLITPQYTNPSPIINPSKNPSTPHHTPDIHEISEGQYITDDGVILVTEDQSRNVTFDRDDR